MSTGCYEFSNNNVSPGEGTEKFSSKDIVWNCEWQAAGPVN